MRAELHDLPIADACEIGTATGHRCWLGHLMVAHHLRPEAIDDVLIDLMNPMLRKLSVSNVEEIHALPFHRGPVPHSLHSHQRRRVVIAGQNVVDLWVKRAIR